MLRGIFAPIPTPFVDEAIAYDKLESNLAKWGATGLSGVVVLGSNGEQPYVDEDEKVDSGSLPAGTFPMTKRLSPAQAPKAPGRPSGLPKKQQMQERKRRLSSRPTISRPT